MPSTDTPSRALVTYPRNVSSPKSFLDLPEELITYILLLLVPNRTRCQVHPVIRTCFPSCPPDVDWTLLMQVNKALRRIGLSYPLLWTNVSSCRTVEAFKTTIQRSKHLPLHVIHPEISDETGEGTRARLRLIFSQSYRLQGLDLFIFVRGNMTGDELQRFLDVPMPLLRYLKLWVEFVNFEYRRRAMRFVLHHDAPSLKYIEVAGLLVIHSQALIQVTGCCLMQGAIHWPVEDIVDLLKGLPQLRTLWINKAPPPDGPKEHINLPLLRNLEIHATEGTLELLHDQLFINAPQLRHLRLIGSNPVNDDYDSGMPLFDFEFLTESRLVRQITRLPHQVPHVYDMTISVAGPTITTLSLLTRPLDCPAEDAELQLLEYIDLEMDFVKVCDTLDIHPLQSLVILNDLTTVTVIRRTSTNSTQSEYTDLPWISYFGDSPTITLIEFQVAGHLRSFVTCCRDSDRPLFPALQVILVRNLTTTPGDSIYHSLESLLKERRKRGLQIEVVTACSDGGYTVLSSSSTIDHIKVKPIHELPPHWRDSYPHGFEGLGGMSRLF